MYNMFQRTLNGADMINATSLNLPPNENAVRINGDFGTAGQVLAKDENNKLNWSRVDDVEIPDNSISGEKLKSDISITTTGDIQATNITATNILKTNTTLDLPFTTSAINITGGGGNGSAGQVLVKDGDNKLAWDFVDDIEIPDRSIAGVKLVEKTITEAEIGDDAIITRTINDDAITTAKINDGAITTAKVGDLQITAGKLASNSVITDKIKDANVTADKLATDSVTTDKVVDGAITTAKVGDLQITTGKIANGGVSALKLATDSVTTDKVENGAITNVKIADGTIAGGKLATDIAITTTGSIQAYEITATHRFIQTGAQTNSFAGALSTTKSYLQTDASQLNIFDGPLNLTKAGNVSPPTILGDGGYALQVGDGSTDADVYIKRNLVVDGTIHGNIQGDITDTHIDAQSLTLEDKGDAGGLTGLRIKDNYNFIMTNNLGHQRTNIDGTTGDINAFRHINLTTQSSQLVGNKVAAGGGSYEVNTPQKNFDFASDTNTNLAGRVWTKIWAPPRQTGGGTTGSQVNYKFMGLKTGNQWYSVGAYSNMTNFTGRLTGLDITIKPRTTRIYATLTISCACNHQFGMRLGMTSGPSTPSFSSGYLQLGDDWSNDDYLGRGRWTWDFYLSGLTKNSTYVLHPEVYVPYFARADGLAVAIQFWVGNLAGSSTPAENQEADGPAIFRVTELPDEDVEADMFQEDTTTAGPYPSANVNQVQSYWSDEPESDDY